MERLVRNWILLGIVLVFFQIVIGGITRLTGSGLSITKWEIITGTLPPVNSIQWEEAFDLYKATPQYQKINEGMALSDFKFIYFWEYFHRLWARMMGFAFIIPFIFFLIKGVFTPRLKRQLLAVFMLAILAASFGWIMVASGLINRPWVNAYKLSIHLNIALGLFALLVWIYYSLKFPKPNITIDSKTRRLAIIFTIVLAVQLFVGGVMSGSKAGLTYPTFPTMNGELIPSVLLNGANWNYDNFANYDQGYFMSAIFQFVHRIIAYILGVVGVVLTWKLGKYKEILILNRGRIVLISLLIIQILLGIFTVVNCVGNIPLWLGVSHQMGAIFLLTATLFIDYQTN